MATRSSSSSPSAPPTFQAQSAWPSSGTSDYKWAVSVSKPSQEKQQNIGWKCDQTKQMKCKKLLQDHWTRGNCLQLSVNPWAKLQQPGDSGRVWCGCGVYGLVWWDLSGWFGLFVWLWVACSCCCKSRVGILFFLGSGDDDIGPRHDLHHVPNYYHQIIDQIGIQYFSVWVNDKNYFSKLSCSSL